MAHSPEPRAAEPHPRRLDLDQARVVLDQIPGAVLVLDPEGRVVYLNGIAELRLDLPRADVMGRDFFREVMPQLEAAGVGERYRAAMAEGRVALGREVSLPTSRGDAEVTIGVRSLELGGARWGLVLLEDRTALALERGRRRRAERLAAIGELATGVAHEINNPLATIRGFAQLLARDVEGEEQAQALSIIDAECGRIARTIHSLQAFIKRQEAGETGLVDLSEIVREILELKRYGLETAGIEIEADLTGDPSPVHAGVDVVQRVVLSLVAHAEHALHESEGERKLVVRTRESTDGVVLYVIDNGPGIPKDVLPTLFRGPAEGREDAPLGLDVAAGLVREHGGQIWADSAEGKGTAVFVRFPRAEDRAREEDESAPGAAEVPAGPMRVLVADDEASLRMALALFIGREGHQVVEAGNAADALRIAREQPIDLALIDVRMPGDGLSLLDSLEEIPSLRGRTVLMTGDPTHPRVRARIASGHPSLIKPFDMTEIVHMVEALGRAG